MARQVKRPWWHRVALYGGVTLGVYLLICWFLAHEYIYPGRIRPTKPASLVDVTVVSGDDETPAWATKGLAQGHSSDVVFVFAHGYGGNRGHWDDAIADLAKQGYDSIVPALPGQDASLEKQVGFGPGEARVLVQTIAWVRTHSTRKPKIVLVGVSMGGAAAWLASAMDPSIDAVVTEGAYASFERAMDHYLDFLPGGHGLWRPVVWFARGMSGIDPTKIVPEKAAAKWRGRPALVIQAGGDTLIEAWHAKQLSAAAGCELWTVPNSSHANCYGAAREEYSRRLAEMARTVKSGEQALP